MLPPDGIAILVGHAAKKDIEQQFEVLEWLPVKGEKEAYRCLIDEAEEAGVVVVEDRRMLAQVEEEDV